MESVFFIFISLALVLLCAPLCSGHGYLLDPPARASMWRQGFRTPINYDDNGIRCGGSKVQCGVCGDAVYLHPRPNEAGGKYATGIISRTYTEGQVLRLQIVITVNHMGTFQFTLCENNNVNKVATEECFYQHVLKRTNGETKWRLDAGVLGNVFIDVQLPLGVTCSQCILRWKWTTGNSWGVDPISHKSGLGYGPQEMFYGCSDIAIKPRNGDLPTLPPVETTRTTRRRIIRTRSTKKTTKTQGVTTRVVTPKTGRLTCKAINNWKGQKELDQWCDYNCNNNYSCPKIFCKCY